MTTKFVEPKMKDAIAVINASFDQPATWDEAAAYVVSELGWQQGWKLEHMRPADIEDYYHLGRWDILARACLGDIKAAGTLDVVGTLIGKQSDYGPRNILQFGTEGLAVRLWDKIARLNNIMAHGNNPHNESLVDTKLDIVGYTVLAIMLELGWFTLPLKRDVDG